MSDISNKTLTLFLLVAIAISISGTMTVLYSSDSGITGYLTSTQSGKTNFSINSSLSITLNNALIPFGMGTVNQSHTSCAMGTNNTPPATPNCLQFNTTVHTANITIENNGNILANVSVHFDKNATTFIGGNDATPLLKYQVRNVEASSCTTARNGTTMTDVDDRYATNSSANARICNGLKSDTTTDLLDLGIWINIPRDTTTGEHTVALTFTGCDDASC